MKKIILSLIIAISLTANAQIPTTDGAKIGQSITQHIETLAKYEEQYKKLNEQLGEAKEIYNKVDNLNNTIRKAQMERVAKSEVYTDTVSKQITTAVNNIKKPENKLATSEKAKKTADTQAKIAVQTKIDYNQVQEKLKIMKMHDLKFMKIILENKEDLCS